MHQPVDILVASKVRKKLAKSGDPTNQSCSIAGSRRLHMSGDLDDVGCLNLVVGAEDRALGSLPLSSFVEPPALGRH